MPLGKAAASVALFVGLITSLGISLGTNWRDVTIHPTNLCNSAGVGYTQTGSPYGVQSPNLQGDYLPSNGSSCLALGDWTDTHLNYWHLLLNGLYWTTVVYVALLVLMHAARRILGRARRGQ
jgi:hypothetical protein